MKVYGSKAKNLIKLSYNGVTVPKTWVISNNYPLSLLKRYKINLENLDEIINFFDKFPKQEYRKLYDIVKEFTNKNKRIKRFAIRSSQLYEDGKDNSFSGLFYTELNVGNIVNIVNAIVKCWKESFNVGVIEYSKKNNEFKPIPCSVIIQQFILSNKSGVVFKIDDKIILDANFGLAKSIVDGDTGCDEWILNNGDIVKYSNNKEKADIPVTRRINPNVKDKINYQNYSDLVVSKFNNTDTTIKVDLPLSLSEKKVMSETEIEKLLKVCESVSKILNIKNYDIEWTIDEKGNIYILQCRPITTKFEVGKMEQNENKKFGIGLVNGEVIGKVIRIIDENTAKKFEQGSILVTKRLAGYSLMAANKAIGCIIESKSPLSHSAIIARELGIPVVGNVDINSICNNERYYINGKTGEYKIVKNSNINKNETRLNNKEISLSQKLKNNLLKVIESFDQDIV